MASGRDIIGRLVASPCSNPEMDLPTALCAYSELGFRGFEVFTSWVKSAFDVARDPEEYLAFGRRYGMAFHSFHLPHVTDDLDASVEAAVKAAKFAAAVGAKVVLYKRKTREDYVRGAKPFLDAIEATGLTPVVQNHFGTAVSSLDDFREVMEGIADPRMKTLLEVGHFHSAGVHWREGCELLGDTIALVHVKDQIGRQSVPFGAGEIDLVGLYHHMESVGYDGSYVVEMEVEDRENTLRYLADAVEYLRQRWRGGA